MRCCSFIVSMLFFFSTAAAAAPPVSSSKYVIVVDCGSSSTSIHEFKLLTTAAGLRFSAGLHIHVLVWHRRCSDRLRETQRRHPAVLDLASADMHRGAANANLN